MNKTALLVVTVLAAQMSFAQSKAVSVRATETKMQETKAREAVTSGAATGVKVLDQARVNAALTQLANKVGITNASLRDMLSKNASLEETLLDLVALSQKANKTKAEQEYVTGLESILEVYGKNSPTSLTANERIEVQAAVKIVSEIAGKFNEYGSPSQMASLIREIGSGVEGNLKLNSAVVAAVKKVYGKKTDAEVQSFLREIIRCKV